jgi:3-mercaptopyruvate sulfurtransferase SseA
MIRMFRGANISIVDVRPADAFSQGHLPFSINVPAESLRNNLASPDKLAAMLGPAGIDAAHEAVIVSGAGLTKDSALAFVMLQKLGQKKVSLFMDSMDKWTQLGQPVKKDATVVGPKKTPQDLSIPPTNYPASFRPDVVISAAQRTQGLFPRVVLASGQQLTGKAPEGTVVHVPYTDLLTADGLPKPAKDIWNILSKAGVPRYAELIFYSEDPGEAAVNYFVLKLMGYPDVKVLLPSAAQVASSAAMR